MRSKVTPAMYTISDILAYQNVENDVSRSGREETVQFCVTLYRTLCSWKLFLSVLVESEQMPQQFTASK